MFNLPTLPYQDDSLEPHIDKETMKIHYGKHHLGYVNKLNFALEKYPELSEKSIEDILTNLNDIPEEIRDTVRKNGGGFLNHSIFWKIMVPGGKNPSENMMSKIISDFGDFKSFKSKFTSAAMARFGSGWVWLCINQDGNLHIESTPNQDNPIMKNINHKPILGLDVWEHAYYLKYQNRRSEYVDAWWSVVNWSEVENMIN